MLVHPPLCIRVTKSKHRGNLSSQHVNYSTAQLKSLLLLFPLFCSRSLSFIVSSRPPPDCTALSFFVVFYFSSPHLLTSFQILINNQSSVDSMLHSPNPLRAPPTPFNHPSNHPLFNNEFNQHLPPLPHILLGFNT